MRRHAAWRREVMMPENGVVQVPLLAGAPPGDAAGFAASSSPPGPPAEQAEVDALVRKHHAEIDRIRALNSSAPIGTLDQQGEFEKFGVNIQALKEHYKDLWVKNKDLLERSKRAGRHTAFIGWGAFAAALAGSFWHREKFAPKNTLLQGVFMALFSAFTGVIAGNTASYVFNRKIRLESRDLVREAGGVFERELAIAIENNERESGKALPTVMNVPTILTPSGAALPVNSFAARTDRTPQIAPREKYAAEVTKEKAMAEGQAIAH